MNNNPQVSEEDMEKAREILNPTICRLLGIDPTLDPITQLKQGIDHGLALLSGMRNNLEWKLHQHGQRT
jgi:hypothetical protein